MFIRAPSSVKKRAAAPVTVQTASDELVEDQGRVVRTLNGALLDLRVRVEGRRDAGNGEVAVVGKEETELHVRRKIEKNQPPERGLPIRRGGVLLAMEAGDKCGVVLQDALRTPSLKFTLESGAPVLQVAGQKLVTEESADRPGLDLGAASRCS